MTTVMVFLNSGSACVVRCTTMDDGAELLFYNDKKEITGRFQHDQVAGWAVIQEANPESEKVSDKLPAGEKLQ